MKLIDIKTKTEIAPTGRQNISQKARASANLNPIEWSKWLYEIRQQLGRGTSRAEAYRDCRKHQDAFSIDDTMTVNDCHFAPNSP